MKRAGNLIGEIVSWENLDRAWRRARRGKSRSPEARAFERDLEQNLALIGAKLAEGRYHWGAYRHFMIRDPKEREISALPFRDCVAQQALILVCERVFEASQIDQSFACRRGKGQTRAVELAARYSRRARYYLKLDVRKYFASIDWSTLKGQLETRFKDPLILRAFFDAIDSFDSEGDKGLPIGSLTSQFFANHYLVPLDRYIKERLKARYYVRYMDDFILWSDDLDELRRWRDLIVDYADRVLRLTFKESAINSSAKGLPFLGMKIVCGRVRLSSRSRMRFRRKFVEITNARRIGLLSEEKAAERLRALFAFVMQAESKTFRLRVLEDGEKLEKLE